MPLSFHEAYTDFEKNFALAWAQAHLTEYLRTHPNASFDQKYKEFSECIEGGLSTARKFIDDHR